MPLSYNERQNAAREFAKQWRDSGYEKGEAQVFWTELLKDVAGMQRVSAKAKFEVPTPSNGFIDCLIPDAGVLIEQKGIHVNLDKQEQRQGKMVTPFEQALAYAESFKANQQPRFIVVCNFKTFRVHDRERFTRPELPDNYFEFTLDELGEHPEYLDFITDPNNSRLEKQKAVSIEAGRRIGNLRDALEANYLDPTQESSIHSLNVLCVRLVFCLFCEDAHLFAGDAFLNYLRNVPASAIRAALERLFTILDTPIEQRNGYDQEEFKDFPYVNGGLFREQIEIPNFDDNLRHLLLFECSQQTDWSTISPTIFGSIFESTLNPETRHAGGMHYTSPENIHKVIDPMFMDNLLARFEEIRSNAKATKKKRREAFEALLEELASLKIMDPACGSGNFLTESYLSLRQLEDDILNELQAGQSTLDFDALDSGFDAASLKPRVSLDQFYGIEINDFAVTVAQAALWIAKLQADRTTMSTFGGDMVDFPLTQTARIVEGSALEVDWNDVLPASECTYVIGNPPFIGAYDLTSQQKEERKRIFGSNAGVLDYVACWYKVAADYAEGLPVKIAFVSTNSICQGQQVEPLWKPIFNRGFHIDYAWTTFYWSNESTDPAHVHCVIVGFSQTGTEPRRLFLPQADEEVLCENINGYLQPGPDMFVTKRTTQISGMPEMSKGFQATDHGYLLMNNAEKEALLKKESEAARYIRPFSMGADFVQGEDRWCLWLPGVSNDEIAQMPLVEERVQKCFEWRSAQTPTGDAYKLRNTPQLFRPCTKFHDRTYIGVPVVTSSKRSYVPLGFIDNGMIPGNQLYFIESDSLSIFGVMMSRMQNAWMRLVGGRMKSDYRYANTVVYNTFVFPDATPEQKQEIEACAQAVLDARANHPSATLAEMYDGISPVPTPEPSSASERAKYNRFVFNDLKEAHEQLDRAVERAYGLEPGLDETDLTAHLFKLYTAATENED